MTSPAISVSPPPASPARPPPSSVSSETTLPVDLPLPPSPHKRPREEDDGDRVEEPVAQRSRTEDYKPAEGSASWVDWALLPLRTFVRGFREGMNGGPVASGGDAK